VCISQRAFDVVPWRMTRIARTGTREFFRAATEKFRTERRACRRPTQVVRVPGLFLRPQGRARLWSRAERMMHRRDTCLLIEHPFAGSSYSPSRSRGLPQDGAGLLPPIAASGQPRGARPKRESVGPGETGALRRRRPSTRSHLTRWRPHGVSPARGASLRTSWAPGPDSSRRSTL